MHRSCFIRFNLIVCFFLISFTSQSQTVVWSEDFDNNGGSGSNWSTLNEDIGTQGAIANQWYISSAEAGNAAGVCGSAGGSDKSLHVSGNISWSGDLGAAYEIGAGLCAGFPGFCPITDKRTYSNAINTVGVTGMTLNFNYIENGEGAVDDATVIYSINNGTSWLLLDNPAKTAICGSGQGRWTAYSFNLPATCEGITTLRIGFRWINNDGAGADPSFAVDDIQITIPSGATSPVTSILTTTSVACFGGATGVATATTTGGLPAYTYQWYQGVVPGTILGGENDSTISSIAAGDYYVVVTDGNTLKDTAYVTITEPLSAVVADTLAVVHVDCFGGTTGSVTLSGSGGTSPYEYSINGTTYGTTALFSSLAANAYTGYVRDDSGCIETINFTISQPTSALVADTISIVNVSCAGAANGAVTLVGSGGTTPYQYSLDGTTYTSNPVFSNLSAAAFVGYVKDDNGCIATVNFSISQAVSTLAADTSMLTNASCEGISNGSVTLSGSGGTGAYTFSIDGSTFVASPTFSGLVSGSYVGYVKDAIGCIQTINFSIANQYAITFNIIESNLAVCDGETADFNFGLTNGVGNLVYTWTNSTSLVVDESNNTVSASPTETTTYEGFVTDANGCISNTETIVISIDQGVDLDLSDTLVEINKGDIIEIDAGVNDPEVTFSWTPEDGLDDPTSGVVNASPSATITYTVEASTVNGCETTGKVEVIVRAELEIVTAFSPNGDNVNEVWEIIGIENFPDASVKIFNRWGLMLYEVASDYKGSEWDGGDAPAASYFFIINLGDGSADINGTVTIIK